MAETMKRLSPEEYAAEKARKKAARKDSAMRLIELGCPGVLTMQGFTDLLLDQLGEQGVLPRTFSSGSLGYATQGKLVIGKAGHRFQVSIMCTMIRAKGEAAPTSEEVRELEGLSNARLDEGETT